MISTVSRFNVKTKKIKKPINRQKGNNNTYLSSLNEIITKLDTSLNINEDHKIDSSEYIELFPCWLSEMKLNIQNNYVDELISLLNKITSTLQPIPDIEFFYVIGRYCKPETYTLIRNSELIKEYIDKSLYLDAIIEGIAKGDNNALMQHLTTSHQLSHVKAHKIGIYIYALIDNKAYSSLNTLCTYLAHIKTNDTSQVLKQLLSKSFETFDNRIITTLLNTIVLHN